MLATAPAERGESSGGGGEITYVSYSGELHLPLVIFTYRYFVYLWPQLTFLAFDAKEGKCVGTVVCKMGEHRGAFRGYIGMLDICWKLVVLLIYSAVKRSFTRP